MSIDRAISRQIITFKPAGVWIAGLVAGILAITSACESGSGSSSTTLGDDTATSTTSVTTRADFARMFDIGGRMMYMECAGQGSPTVILVSGGGIAGDVWDSPLGKQPTVFPTVAEQTRTCVYDRPGTTRALAEGGISRSDPVPQPVVPSASAADLHALLEASGETGPVVLAAHSYGGLVARYYANRYPDGVVGMVLIDSFSPELRDSMGDNWPAWVRWNAPADAIIADYPDYERVDFDKVRTGGLRGAWPTSVGHAERLTNPLNPYTSTPPGPPVKRICATRPCSSPSSMRSDTSVWISRS